MNARALVAVVVVAGVGCRGRVHGPERIPACAGAVPATAPDPGRSLIQTAPGALVGAAFSADGLLAVGDQGVVNIWDVERRTLVARLHVPGTVWNLAWTAPDRLVVGDMDDDVGREIRVDGTEVGRVDLSTRHIIDTPEGSVLASVDRTGHTLEIQRGDGPVRRVTLPDDVSETPPAAISRDGSTVVAVVPSEDGSSVEIWRFDGDRAPAPSVIVVAGTVTNAFPTPDGTAVVFERETQDGHAIVRARSRDGAIDQIVPYPKDGSWSQVVVSPDGQLIARMVDEKFEVAELGGRVLWSRPGRPSFGVYGYEGAFPTNRNVDLAWFTPDSRSLLLDLDAGNFYAATSVVDATSGALRGELGAAVDRPVGIRFQGSHRLELLSERRQTTWNLERIHGETAKLLEQGEFFGLQGGYPVPGIDDDSVGVTDAVTSVDPDGAEHLRCAVEDLANKKVTLVDVDEVCSALTEDEAGHADPSQAFWAAAGRSVVRVGPGQGGMTSVGAWRADGTRQLDVTVTVPWVDPAGFHEHLVEAYAGGDRIAVARFDQLYDLDLTTGTVTVRDEGEMVKSIAAAPDGALIVTIGDGAIERIEGGNVERVVGDGTEQTVAAFSPDHASMATIGDDGAVRLWSLEPLALVVTLVTFSDDEELAYTPDGFFAGTPDAGARVEWVFDDPLEGFGFEQFAAGAGRADVIAARIAGGSEAGGPATRRPPSISIEDATAHGGVATVRAHAVSRSRVDRIRFFVDGRPAGASAVCAADGEVRADVSLHAGMNRITALAYDDSGMSSNWASAVVTGPAEAARPAVWVVSVGISRYPKLAADEQLSAPDDDARAIADSFRTQVTRGAFSEAHVAELLDGDATAAHVLHELRGLERMAPDDLAIVFFAGHGVKETDAAETLFLTTDASDGDLERGALRWSDVSAALGRARGRVLVLLDACHAGHFARDVLAPNDELATALGIDGRAGVLVYSASKGRQLSYEPAATRTISIRGERTTPDTLPALPRGASNHGLFTAALVEALDDADTDLDHDGDIDTTEWITAVTSRVSVLTGGAQTPWVARREIQGELKVGVVAPSDGTVSR